MTLLGEADGLICQGCERFFDNRQATVGVTVGAMLRAGWTVEDMVCRHGVLTLCPTCSRSKPYSCRVCGETGSYT